MLARATGQHEEDTMITCRKCNAVLAYIVRDGKNSFVDAEGPRLEVNGRGNSYFVPCPACGHENPAVIRREGRMTKISLLADEVAA
jgi:hypothetical protein